MIAHRTCTNMPWEDNSDNDVNRLAQRKSKINRLRRSPKASQPLPRKVETSDITRPEFKTPTRPAVSRGGCCLNKESPLNTSANQLDIIWDHNSPSPKGFIRGKGRRIDLYEGKTDVTALVSRIAPKSGKPVPAWESSMVQWIGDGGIPCTPDLSQPRPRTRTKGPNQDARAHDHLKELARQFDFHLTRQEALLHQPAAHLGKEEEEEQDLQPPSIENQPPLPLPTMVTMTGANPSPPDAVGALSLDHDMDDDDLNDLFDGPTVSIENGLSQPLSCASQNARTSQATSQPRNGLSSGGSSHERKFGGSQNANVSQHRSAASFGNPNIRLPTSAAPQAAKKTRPTSQPHNAPLPSSNSHVGVLVGSQKTKPSQSVYGPSSSGDWNVRPLGHGATPKHAAVDPAGFDDDWGDDDDDGLLSDSLVMEMTQNPDLFAPPKHCSTQKPVTTPLPNHCSQQRPVTMAPPNRCSQQRPVTSAPPKHSTAQNPNLFALPKQPSTTQSAFAPTKHCSLQKPVTTAPPQRAQPAPIAPDNTSTRYQQQQAGSSSSSSGGLVGAAVSRPATIVKEEPGDNILVSECEAAIMADDDDLDMFFASDSGWDDGVDDDDLLCEACDGLDDGQGTPEAPAAAPGNMVTGSMGRQPFSNNQAQYGAPNANMAPGAMSVTSAGSKGQYQKAAASSAAQSKPFPPSGKTFYGTSAGSVGLAHNAPSTAQRPAPVVAANGLLLCNVDQRKPVTSNPSTAVTATGVEPRKLTKTTSFGRSSFYYTSTNQMRPVGMDKREPMAHVSTVATGLGSQTLRKAASFGASSFHNTANRMRANTGSVAGAGQSTMGMGGTSNGTQHQYAFKRPANGNNDVSSTTVNAQGRCSDAEIERKKQEALERRRLRMLATQNQNQQLRNPW